MPRPFSVTDTMRAGVYRKTTGQRLDGFAWLPTRVKPKPSTISVMYRKGQGVPQDYGEAVKWYRIAAEQGLRLSQFGLGLMYDIGWGVPQDYTEAVSWYRKAGNQGQVLAQAKLGAMYLEGNGVTQDYVLAHMWFNLAAAQDQKEARKLLDSLAEKMTPAQIAEAQKLAREWKPVVLKPRAVPQAVMSTSSVDPAPIGQYEVTVPTPVYEGPRAGARKIATIEPGTRINVIIVAGDWLEIRSRHGRPPGFIRKNSAVPVTE